MPRGSRALLDVGAGDGVRAQRIAKASGITDLVLLDPSAQMRTHWAIGVRAWPIRAEELAEKNEAFDAITCLWNVLGYVFPAANRVLILRQCGRLLAPGGRLFVDVNHRYNAVHYGVLPATLFMLHDIARPRDTNGDVTVTWQVGDARYATNGHVFTNADFRRISSSAGLTIEETYVVDYATGEIKQSKFAGNLFYILRRSGAED